MSKKLVVGFGIFMLFQPFLTYTFSNINQLGNLLQNLDEIFILTMFLLSLFKNFLHGFTLRISSLQIFIMAFIGVGLISGVIQGVSVKVLLIGCFQITKGFMLYYIISKVKFLQEDLKVIIKIFFIIGLLFLVGGFIGFINPQFIQHIFPNLEKTTYRFNLVSQHSFFKQPADFAWWMVYIALYCVSAKIVYKNNVFLILAVLFSITAALALKLRFLIGLIAGIIFGVRNIVELRIRKTRGIIILLVFIFVAFLFSSFIGELVYDRYVTFSPGLKYVDSARNKLYAIGFEIANKHFPLGGGFGTYASATSAMYYSDIYYQYGLAYDWGFRDTDTKFIKDTFWPMIIGETGYLGLILYLLILWRFWRLLKLVTVKINKEDFGKLLCLGAIMTFFQALLVSIGEPIFVNPIRIYFLFGLWGALKSLVVDNQNY